MPQRKCTKSKENVKQVSKRIVLPIEIEMYKAVVVERKWFRKWVDEMMGKYPELFPSGTAAKGYTLHDKRVSLKMPEINLRRIKLSTGQVFTIAPSGVLPYMTGYTDDVEKPLFLRRFGVPFWALSYVFGRDGSYWYRVFGHLGRYSIVQTTVKDRKKLPKHLLADEKHSRLNGEKVYIAITVAEDCVLGASVSLTADTEGLTEAYGHFQQEARHLDRDYQPETVNIDGWAATQKAWLALFPSITIIECFLHAFLKIRNRCKKRFEEIYHEIAQRVWDIYHADNPAAFRVQVEALQQWASQTLHGHALEAVEKLCAKVDRFLLTFEHPEAYRTSNMIDRHMEPMDRWLFSSRFFHGHLSSAERHVRAWALFHNFWPYSPRSKISKNFQSPAHKLNGSVYHSNWLHNLLISTSIAGAS